MSIHVKYRRWFRRFFVAGTAGVLLAVILTACARQPERFARSLEGMDAGEALELSKAYIDSIALHDPKILTAEIRDIVETFHSRGDREAAMQVASYPYGVDAAERPDIASRLLTSILLPGTKAPPIEGLAPAREKPKFTVLLFHESACRTCGAIVWELKQRYAELQMAGVRVVTVSTDTDAQVWTEYAAGLPWPDKLCDYRGFYSPAMTAYGVAATPTLFLIDREGVVTDQYGTPEELWSVIFKK